MKNLILLLVLFCFSGLNAQVDPPSGYTDNYKLRMYDDGNRPSADSVNRNLIDIDAAINKVEKSKDSLRTKFYFYHTSGGGLKQNVVSPYNTTTTFFLQYFSMFQDTDEDFKYKLRVDQSQFDNDTLKIKNGVVGFLSGTNGWSGTNSFNASQTNFGNGTFSATNYQIANDIGSIEWKKNGTTILKWDENDGTYFQFLYHIDVVGDVSVSGFFKPAQHTDGEAPNGSIYKDGDHLMWKNDSGVEVRLD